MASAAEELHGEERIARRQQRRAPEAAGARHPQHLPRLAAQREQLQPAAGVLGDDEADRSADGDAARPVEQPGRAALAADHSDQRAARLEELDSVVLRVGDGEEAQLIVASDARRVLELARRRALLAKRAELRERGGIEEDDAVVVAVGDVERAIEECEALGELEGAGLARRTRRERLARVAAERALERGERVAADAARVAIDDVERARVHEVGDAAARRRRAQRREKRELRRQQLELAARKVGDAHAAARQHAAVARRQLAGDRPHVCEPRPLGLEPPRRAPPRDAHLARERQRGEAEVLEDDREQICVGEDLLERALWRHEAADAADRRRRRWRRRGDERRRLKHCYCAFH